MAPRTLLTRLHGEIDRLELALGARPALVVIVQKPSETAAEAKTRHYGVRPQDRDALQTVLVRRFTEASAE